MGLFDFLKRKNPIQQYLDELFGDMAIVDVIATKDIPMVSINGNQPCRESADIFFKDYARGRPERIEGYLSETNFLLWVFDTFLVLEANFRSETSKQFIVIQFVNYKNNYDTNDSLNELLKAQEAAIRIVTLREQLLTPVMETIVCKAAADFFVSNQEQAINIVKSKYY